MRLRRLPAEEPAVRRYVEELWLPYHRELAATVADHALAEDVDVVDEEMSFRLDRLSSEGYRTWVAVDEPAEGRTGGDDPLTDPESALAGFVSADVERSPSVFDRPDRLVVGDIYVRAAFRGTGLAHRLVRRAARYGREAECGELALDVDADNERARSFYSSVCNWLLIRPHAVVRSSV
ncbi:GNAT family N-acetyltransferase [Halogeometricum sp. S1BR25-6]|uniref:GNAT family N-acetyltransferase n=1 Tax=Halogeometricum salsisoli TaxID=2950536 RepID=A0ABU2GDU0_9EURY|nr:GNAT family N-acetyltransferase [Halogeometricum sp. S1BR25-6]MDS0298962.1 GNAT family N-acetyltransferase [Halogeometricum sp. S1BR25-6]